MKIFQRTRLCSSGIIIALLTLISLPTWADEIQKPNVLFIMADDLCTALSGYGHPQCKTPNLDRLAEQGTTFTRAYCQFPLCGPSRASIMSGQYPDTNGVTGNGGRLKESTTTLPKLFREAGYWTGRVSKIYHMGVPGNIYTGDDGTDHEPSWMERYNVSVMESLTPGKAEDVMLEDSTPVYEEYRKKWHDLKNKGGKLFIQHGNHQGSDMVIVEASVHDAELADGAAANKAIEILKQRAEESDPFFLAVGFVRPHVPFVAPERSFTGYTVDEMKVPEVPEGDLDDMPRMAKNQTNAAKYKLSPEGQRKSLRGYYASVTYMDEQVGRLLKSLDELDLRKNTIVIFVSDHGFHLGEHTMWQKMSLLEESIRVPLIISAPGQNEKGAHSDAIIELLDIYPTLADLAGLTTPDEVQGKSFSKLLNNSKADTPRIDALIQGSRAFCLRTSKWAYMRYPSRQGSSDNLMLYDMENDPKQFTNLAAKAEYSKILQEMDQRLAERLSKAKGK